MDVGSAPKNIRTKARLGKTIVFFFVICAISLPALQAELGIVLGNVVQIRLSTFLKCYSSKFRFVHFKNTELLFINFE